MVERFRKELNDCIVIATGGLAHLIAPVAKSIDHVEPFLTLHGLRLVYDLNRGDDG
jgi:type III pantothenate kinase